MEIRTEFSGLDIIEKLLVNASDFEHFCFLNGAGFSGFSSSGRKGLFAIGLKKETTSGHHTVVKKDEHFLDVFQGWKFGFISYDFKNRIENLTSGNPDRHEFPDVYFFEPESVLEVFDQKICIHNGSNALLEWIRHSLQKSLPKLALKAAFDGLTNLNPSTAFNAYQKNFNAIKNHLLAGDIYELNYCLDFNCNIGNTNPLHLFSFLNKQTGMPFSAYFRWKGKHILSFSPERFFRRTGRHMLAQPMKGTNQALDGIDDNRKQQELLRSNKKEIAENVMIVDLVRNDLSKISVPGSVKTEELFGVYRFHAVNQMISTITSNLEPGVSWNAILKALFPMGSMTGAPKIRAMQLIEDFESFKRSVYSGMLGFCDPDGNGDFSVLIRTLCVDGQTGEANFPAGSAITWPSKAEDEYRECLLKTSFLKSFKGLVVA